jgi:flagellar motility protein MotE (MotC chaperone)
VQVDYDEISYLRSQSGAWRLLRADSAPFVLAVLGRIFVLDNARSMAEGELVARVDEELHGINSTLDAVGDRPAYPRSARDYVDTWAAPEQGWLRKYYPDGTTEAHYDATSDLEKAHAWVSSLQARSFVGTESRLHTLIELLRQMVHGAETDPASRLAELHRQRAELDAEISRTEAGDSPPLDTVGLLDRYQHFEGTARELLSDFREVEENFRALDRGAREQIAAWDGSKGELLKQLVGDRHAIAASDQGRSFQAVHDFLLSRTRQDELSELLDRLVTLDQVAVDRRLRHVHHDWLDAAERTQQTVRQLSEQLRRFLDDKVWLENRRVMDLLRSIERSALEIRHTPRPALTTELDALAPQLRLPMERPLYTAAPGGGLHVGDVTDADEDVDASSLFEQVHVDTARLVATVRGALRGRDQVSLAEVLEQHPPVLGLAEIVAYLAISEDDLDLVVDESSTSHVEYTDAGGVARVLRMPLVTLVRHRVPTGSPR